MNSISLTSAFLAILLVIFISLSQVNSEKNPSKDISTGKLYDGEDCPFDGKTWQWRTKIGWIRSRWYNTCTRSVIYPRRYGRVITIRLYNIRSLDCNHARRTNNLILRDSDGLEFDYCASLPFDSTVTTFETTARYVEVIKLGKVKLNFQLTLPKVTEPTEPSTTPTTTTTPRPTNPPTTTTTSRPTEPSTPVPTIFTTTIPSDNNRQCGIPKIQPDESGLLFRIVGGKDAAPNSWPWQVYITDGNYLCGASLIDNQWLVTAAHCNFDLSSWYAYLGDHNIIRQDGETIIKIEDFIQHPLYARNEEYDIALLRLDTPVEFTDKIQPVCLPGGTYTDIGAQGIVTGWGVTSENGATSNTLQQTTITSMNPSNCRSLVNSDVSICAGENTQLIHDSCQGDSGGPYVIKDTATGSYHLAGVVSSGIGCKGNGVYVRVSAFEQWIKDTIADY